jgi:L-ascorbate metabolism protein UlaG (beta-lactamase superfamily)
MTSEPVFLKPNVVIEPLIDSWYAWTHLLSPATAALNVTKRHMDIIDSYLHDPLAHAQAVANPKMRGGPFMDLPGQPLEEIKALRERTVRERPGLFALAAAIKELNTLLQAQAKGYSLEPLYQKVPDILKGYVELYYDLSNNPSFRFFESLLYKSEFHCEEAQEIALWLTDNDHRPFCLSTPRLPDAHTIRMRMPFSHRGIDDLARMKRSPLPLEKIRDRLGIAAGDIPLFETFFTAEPPRPYRKYDGDKIRMRYFGHACILIETKELSILLDPLISYYGYPSDVDHFSDFDLPETIDYVLITHNHQDHILLETLLPLRHKIRHLIVPGSKGGRLEDPELPLLLRAIGFRNVVAMDEMEKVSFHDCVITGLPFTGEHCDLNIQSKLCYHVEIGKFSLLFMADSRIMEPAVYSHVHREIGDVDVIFLGMECDGAPLSWLYGPLLPRKLPREQDGGRRLAGSDCEKGLSLVDIFHPRELYVYAMGQEPWLEFISSIKYTEDSNPIVQSDKLIGICGQRGILAERLFGEKEILYERKPESLSINVIS